MGHREEWESAPSERPPENGAATSELGRRALAVLKRRWKVIAVLAGLTMPVAAAAGWKFGAVEYTSTATVHVRPMLQTILYRDEEKGVMPMYDSFVNTQMELLRNRRVVDLAVQDPRWQQQFGSPTAEAVATFTNTLAVARRGELVRLSCTADTPGAAQAGVVSMIGAYRRIYVEQDNQSDEQRLAALQQRQTSLSAEVAAVRQRVASAANAYGTEDLEPLYASRQKQVADLEFEIQKLRLTAPATRPTEAAPTTRIASVRDAARVDKTLADLLARRDELALRDEILAERLGTTHATRVAISREIEVLDRSLESRLSELKAGGGLEGVAALSDDPAERVRQLETLLESSKAELLTLGRQQLTISELRREEVRLREDIDRVKQRIDQLVIEGATAGRLLVVNEGEMPVFASKDSRVRNAGLGAFTALFASGALVVGLGLMNRRVRNLDDVMPGPGTGPILGVLPEVPEGLEDPTLASQAAHNVHHVRTMLEVWAGGRMPLSLTITSPSSGSGKTSLTLSLGVSFAAAGLRTLLVDLDVVGGGLSTRVEGMTRRKLGGLLVARGIITDVQRMEALKRAAETNTKLGKVCVALGYATEEQISEALEAQMAPSSGRAGVIDALEGTPIADCVSTPGIPNLWVMSLGDADTTHAGALSAQRIRRMIQQAGREYDVILVDTGPSPGSLEAAAAAVATDGAVLAIARGEARGAVHQCTSHLTRIGARLAGVVFNRATGHEMARLSASRSSSYGSVPRSAPRLAFDDRVEAPSPPTDRIRNMGPVAGAVATNVRGIRGDDQEGGPHPTDGAAASNSEARDSR